MGIGGGVSPALCSFYDAKDASIIARSGRMTRVRWEEPRASTLLRLTDMRPRPRKASPRACLVEGCTKREEEKGVKR